MSRNFVQQVKEFNTKISAQNIPPSEADLCELEENDLTCGQIYFNEDTRMLKFLCTYCEDAFYDVNHFCAHLGEHINEHLEEYVADENSEETDQTDCQTTLMESEAQSKDLTMETLIDSHEMCEDLHDDSECDEVYNIAARNEYLKEPENLQNLFMNIDGQANKLKESSELRVENELGVNTISFTDTLVESPEQMASKKQKKVTTVKIIVVKNRIEELYNMIKLEGVKRSGTKDNEVNDVDTPTFADSTESSEETSLDSVDRKSSVVLQHIIGETVITHIPNISNSSTPPLKADISKKSQCGVGSERQSSTHVSGKSLSTYFAETDERSTCPACGEKFRNSFSLSIHKRKHYLESTNQIKLAHKCSDCNQLFNKISEMKTHLQTVHYPNGFICKICNKKLSSISLLELHMRKVHLSRPFNCKVCRKNFDDREFYEAHVSSHESDEIFKCSICGRKYSTEKILKLHIDRHKERVPQNCTVCGKVTLRIKQHMKTHVPRPKRVLSCKICGKHFNFSSGLSHHFKMWHKNPRPSQMVKKGRRRLNARQTNDNLQQINEVIQKEEEAKRVIVEVIEDASNTYVVENTQIALDATPPIAREETISAVNNLVEYC